jgi:anthranilate/para-aminobenzoate synthase component II
MIHIVDYKAGNITSVRRALESLRVESVITPDPDAIRRAEKIIFPGVGQAASAMQALRERGLDAALREAFARGTPILGICLGAQIVLLIPKRAIPNASVSWRGNANGFRFPIRPTKSRIWVGTAWFPSGRILCFRAWAPARNSISYIRIIPSRKIRSVCSRSANMESFFRR